MKLHSGLLFSLGYAWEQPTYEEAMKQIFTRSKSAQTWGYPVGRIAADYTNCPALETPPGASGIECADATCAMVCPAGFIGTGRRRVRCRYKKRENRFFWKQQLGQCETCEWLADPPSSVQADCHLTGTPFNPTRQKKNCFYTCKNGSDFVVGNKTPKTVRAVCKCPRRRNGERDCGWYSRKLKGKIEQYDIDQLQCESNAEPTTPKPTTTEAMTTTKPKTTTEEKTTIKPTTTTSEKTTAAVTTTMAEGEFAKLSDNISSLAYCTAADNGLGDSGRIIGGVFAEANSWPAIVHLRFDFSDGSGWSSSCGGTIIANNWVLSAAHCCWESRQNKMFPKVDAIFGGNTGWTNTLTDGFMLESTTMINHPAWSGGNMDYCLIKFSEDLIARGNGNTKIACLPEKEIGVASGGNACWVAGWGDTISGTNTAPAGMQLKSVGVNIFSQDYCVKHTKKVCPGQNGGADYSWNCSEAEKVFEGVASDDICAGVPDGDDADDLIEMGIDSCQGDSGGPLICPINGKATLVGVVSRGGGTEYDYDDNGNPLYDGDYPVTVTPNSLSCAAEGEKSLYSATFFVNNEGGSADSQWIKDTIKNN